MTELIELTPRQWILSALDNEVMLISGIKQIFNCREADVDNEGDI